MRRTCSLACHSTAASSVDESPSKPSSSDESSAASGSCVSVGLSGLVLASGSKLQQGPGQTEHWLSGTWYPAEHCHLLLLHTNGSNTSIAQQQPEGSGVSQPEELAPSASRLASPPEASLDPAASETSSSDELEHAPTVRAKSNASMEPDLKVRITIRRSPANAETKRYQSARRCTRGRVPHQSGRPRARNEPSRSEDRRSSGATTGYTGPWTIGDSGH